MHLVYINPNATIAMTQSVVTTARAYFPGGRISGLTNTDGPPAIQGPQDGVAAVPGLLHLVSKAQAMGADAIVIACFDDTGLAEARSAARCPVLGIGQSSYVMAHLLGARFSVVTSLEVSVPVIRTNIERTGFANSCASVRASGLPVLEIDAGGEVARVRLADEIQLARDQDGATAVVLGCAGMAPLWADLTKRTQIPLIDGVASSAQLADSIVRYQERYLSRG